MSSNCCSVQPKTNNICPMCKNEAKGVLAKTLDSLLNNETKNKIQCKEGYSYCKTPSCNVIYFKDTNILTQKNLTVDVGVKENSKLQTVCYCFDWNKSKITQQLKDTGSCDALEDIKSKMSTIGCSCETLNPSGKCCLKDVTEAINNIKANL